MTISVMIQRKGTVIPPFYKGGILRYGALTPLHQDLTPCASLVALQNLTHPYARPYAETLRKTLRPLCHYRGLLWRQRKAGSNVLGARRASSAARVVRPNSTARSVEIHAAGAQLDGEHRNRRSGDSVNGEGIVLPSPGPRQVAIMYSQVYN